ncbi:hypothetical protein DC522_23635 [Microvirga sp. KLBC 81]|uniref:hypothetical protein n=1 Tax=Microvirga sp. KLBC 81 TaxID=1862707 RepID=UPI000D509C51|nr:hypothetical protein [Microvirga sp. KLBC 81]PVE22005.1 hypothetical protein DC522_23635 [Microvirga sp. KLBC 81]
MTTPAAVTRDKILFLATGLAGSFLVNLSAQFPSANIVDIQQGLSSTPDEASWILTVYIMASFAGIVTLSLFIRALRVGRYMVVGTGILKPADLPTAPLVLNVSTISGATPGVGLVSRFVAERQKLHASVITENASLYHAFDVDRITSFAGAFAAPREAWVLAFNDACLVIAVVSTLGIVAALAMGRSSPLPRPCRTTQGEAP